MSGTREQTSLPFDFAQDGGVAKEFFRRLPGSLTKLLDHVSAFQTITKRAIIPLGTDTTKHR